MATITQEESTLHLHHRIGMLLAEDAMQSRQKDMPCPHRDTTGHLFRLITTNSISIPRLMAAHNPLE